jgi:hypothetical protein
MYPEMYSPVVENEVIRYDKWIVNKRKFKANFLVELTSYGSGCDHGAQLLTGGLLFESSLRSQFFNTLPPRQTLA